MEYEMEEEDLFLLEKLGKQTGTVMVWLRHYYINTNDESIDDILHTLDTSNSTTGDIASILINSYKLLLKDIYWSFGLQVTEEDVLYFTINKHVELLQALLNIKNVDMATAIIIKDILEADLDNITKIQLLVGRADGNVPIDFLLNLISDINPTMFDNIKLDMDKIINDDTSMIPDVDIKNNHTDILIYLTQLLDTKYGLTNINSDITDLLVDVSHVKYLSYNTQDIITRLIKELKFKQFDKDDILFNKLLVNKIMLVLVLKYIEDKEDYINETKFILQEFIADNHTIVNEVNDIIIESGLLALLMLKG